MKSAKLFISFLAIALALAFTACQKEVYQIPQTLTFTIEGDSNYFWYWDNKTQTTINGELGRDSVEVITQVVNVGDSLGLTCLGGSYWPARPSKITVALNGRVLAEASPDSTGIITFHAKLTKQFFRIK